MNTGGRDFGAIREEYYIPYETVFPVIAPYCGSLLMALTETLVGTGLVSSQRTMWFLGHRYGHDFRD
jgi:hypothetical protein